MIPHLFELKKKLLIYLIVFFIVFATCFPFAETFYKVLSAPLLKTLNSIEISAKPIVYFNITEAFTTYLYLCFAASLFITFPFLEALIWQFIKPGLKSSEQKKVFPYLFFFIPLFFSGACFAFLLVIPNVWEFFLSFQSKSAHGFTLEYIPRMEDYFSTTLKLLFTFGICFQLPLILKALIETNLTTVSAIQKKRRFFIIGIFIFAAMMTPPDILSQVALALPMLALFEISLVLLYLSSKKKNKGENHA